MQVTDDLLALAMLADRCLDGAECLYDPALHEGPDDPAEESPTERAVREQVAAEVCAACPVREACLKYALRARPERGVWAGLTAAEVAALADERGIGVVSGAPGTATKHAPGAPVSSRSKETPSSMRPARRGCAAPARPVAPRSHAAAGGAW